MDFTVNDAHEYLTESGIATEDEIALVSDINGYSLQTMEVILESRTGYRSFDQIVDEEE